MRLTRFTDYSLRVVLYLATHGSKRVTQEEISAVFGISRNHLMKIVQHLSAEGIIETFRGKQGGMVLNVPPGELTVGTVVRSTERDLDLIDCHDPPCGLAGACSLKGALDRARDAFLEVLDGTTVEEVLSDRKMAAALSGVSGAVSLTLAGD